MLQGGRSVAAMTSNVPDCTPLIVDHPAVQDRLARLRDASTPTPGFRRLVQELGQLFAYEATPPLAAPDRDRAADARCAGQSAAHRDAPGRGADTARRSRFAPGIPGRRRRRG